MKNKLLGKYVLCAQCGQKVYKPPSQLKRSKRFFCCPKCQIDWLHNMARNGNYRESYLKGQRKRYEGHRVKVNCPVCGKEMILAVSDVKRGRKYCSRECYLTYFRNYIENNKEEFIEKSKHKTFSQPNVPENKVLLLLQNIYPGEWVFSGAGRFITISGMRPDFFNITARKEVIEVFGDYYHSSKWKSRNEIETLNKYRRLGFHCLIIWERDVERLSETDLKTRILEFRRGYES